MAQSVIGKEKVPDRYYEGTNLTVTVGGTGDTSIAKIDVRGMSKLCFHINVATQNLDNFDVLVKGHPDATQRDITPANWASLAAGEWRFKYASGDLAALAAAGNGYFEMDVSGLTEVEIEASAAADSASVSSRWTVS